MNAIKTYLLPLFLLLFFAAPSFAQSNPDGSKSQKQEQQLSETDSILVNCYFTEKEYNRIHGVDHCTTGSDSEYTYEDEIYNGEENKKRDRGNFFENIPAEVVAEVLINTLLFVAILWQ
jgi:hypothetical protein